MTEHFFIVYDFVSDKRRAKFVKILEQYGQRVQYSIFEFFLTPARRLELFAALGSRYLGDFPGEAIMVIPVSRDTEKKVKRFGDTVSSLASESFFSI